MVERDRYCILGVEVAVCIASRLILHTPLLVQRHQHSLYRVHLRSDSRCTNTTVRWKLLGMIKIWVPTQNDCFLRQQDCLFQMDMLGIIEN